MSDVIQTNRCILSFPGVKEEIFVSDNIFITLLVLVSSLYPIIFLKLFRFETLLNKHLCLIHPNITGVLSRNFHKN